MVKLVSLYAISLKVKVPKNKRVAIREDSLHKEEHAISCSVPFPELPNCIAKGGTPGE